jgi:hypothetical protein
MTQGERLIIQCGRMKFLVFLLILCFSKAAVAIDLSTYELTARANSEEDVTELKHSMQASHFYKNAPERKITP